MTERPVPRICSVCLEQVPGLQIRSLVHTAEWLWAWPAEAKAETVPGPGGEMVVVRLRPDCESCAAREEPPFHRHPETARIFVPQVRLSVSAFTLRSVEAEALLASQALAWVMPEAVVEPGVGLEVGPAGRHALIVVNNLLQAARPGKFPGCGSMGGLQEPTEECLDKIEKAILAGHPDEQVRAADVILLHWLNRTLGRLVAFAQTVRKPEPPKPKGLRASDVPGPLGLAFGLLAGAVALAFQFWFLLPVAAAAAGFGVWRLFKTKAAPAEEVRDERTARLAWAFQLQQGIRESREAYATLLPRLSQTDLLQQAGTLFQGMSLDDPRDAAAFLGRLYHTPMGPPLIKWIARAAGRKAEMARLCAVGEALLGLDAPGDGQAGSRRIGAEIAGLLAWELVQAHRGDGGEKSPLWEKAAWESVDDSGKRFSFPRLVRRLFHSAAELEGRPERNWTEREGRFVVRCRDLALLSLVSAPLVNPHWHLFQIRLLRDALEGGWESLRFPSWSECSLISLCKAVENAYRAYRPREEGVRETGADPDIREQVAKEAWDVMHMKGFLLSLEFMTAAERPDGGRLLFLVRSASLLDRLLNQQLAPPPPPGRTRAGGPIPPPPPSLPPPGGGAALGGAGGGKGPVKPPAKPRAQRGKKK